MVSPSGEIVREIAARYHCSETTVKRWTARPGWPGNVGKRGRWYEYDPAAVDDWVRKNVTRPDVDLEASRLYTAQQLEEAGVGITAATIRADRSRGRWPGPDATDHGVDRWLGKTAQDVLSKRRGYRKKAS
ncbi:hypothetical protein [Streptomyces sp. NPDC001404]|uniref:hypothetical protein n=1 Tax=Streptomyces sp. NPDC001404 TaxID=3364571 RepID=UPI0036B5C84A